MMKKHGCMLAVPENLLQNCENNTQRVQQRVWYFIKKSKIKNDTDLRNQNRLGEKNAFLKNVSCPAGGRNCGRFFFNLLSL